MHMLIRLCSAEKIIVWAAAGSAPNLSESCRLRPTPLVAMQRFPFTDRELTAYQLTVGRAINMHQALVCKVLSGWPTHLGPRLGQWRHTCSQSCACLTRGHVSAGLTLRRLVASFSGRTCSKWLARLWHWWGCGDPCLLQQPRHHKQSCRTRAGWRRRPARKHMQGRHVPVMRAARSVPFSPSASRNCSNGELDKVLDRSFFFLVVVIVVFSRP